MLTIFLCDDRQDMLEKYSRWIEKAAKQNATDIELSAFNSGESLLFAIADEPNMADIIYLDIMMGTITGIEVARRMRESGSDAKIIFLSASEDYVFESFDTMPVHYLLKNETTFEKFSEVFMRAASMAEQKTEESFVCKAGASQKVIPVRQISYFEIWRGQITVHYGDQEKFQYWLTMEELESQLQGKSFVRVHRSYLVNILHIASFQRQKVLLKSGESIPVGRTYEAKVKETFSEYIANRSEDLSRIAPLQRSTSPSE